ncbi:MAG: glucose-6-phosphate isomerase, partial [Gammaproteobacteria bacterium]
PHSLGMLVAAYEHKTYVQAVLWNINAFDQWGVELGKKLSSTIYQAFDSGPDNAGIDNTTLRLIEWVRQHN